MGEEATALDLHLPAALGLEAGVARLLDALEAFAAEAALGAHTANALALIAEEVVANVLTHGQEGPEPATEARVAVRPDGGLLLLVLEDDGPEFDPLSAEAPRHDPDMPLEDRAIGGLGLHFIRSFAREARYARLTGPGRPRNRLELWLERGE